MKTTLTKSSLFFIVSIFFYSTIFSQITLAFTGVPSMTGTAGGIGAKYTYANVGTTGAITIKAVIEIINITGGAVLEDIDGTATGSPNAFQPSIYGSQTDGNSWAILFRISFYNAADGLPLVLSSYRCSGIDIDGTATLREFNTFYYPSSYTLNNPNNLSLTVTNGVYRFLAPGIGYSGISLTTTDVAVTCLYNNRSFMDILIGSQCLGGSCSAVGASRQHSINFFDAVAFGSPLIVLPVKLTSFAANKISSGVFLSWTSAEEISLSHYILQRSDDGMNFSDISSIQAISSNHTYTYTDNTPLQGIAYYRLKTVDIDDKFSFSRIIPVKSQVNGLVFLSVSPNPVVNDFSITVQSDKIQQVDFRLINNEGRTVKSFHHSVTRGINMFPAEIPAILLKGVYFLQAITPDGGVSNTKVVVQ